MKTFSGFGQAECSDQRLALSIQDGSKVRGLGVTYKESESASTSCSRLVKAFGWFSGRRRISRSAEAALMALAWGITTEESE